MNSAGRGVLRRRERQRYGRNQRKRKNTNRASTRHGGGKRRGQGGVELCSRGWHDPGSCVTGSAGKRLQVLPHRGDNGGRRRIAAHDKLLERLLKFEATRIEKNQM